LNSYKIQNEGQDPTTFKGYKLSDTIIKIGSGRVFWKKYEVFHLPHEKKFILCLGKKSGQKEKYRYQIHKVNNFSQLCEFIPKEDSIEREILGKVIKYAFDIFYAGIKSAEIKDRKYRLNKKLKQLPLEMLGKMAQQMNTPLHK